MLRLLCEDPGCARVTALVRRPLGFTHPKLSEAPLDSTAPSADDFFLCLGTTIKKAGSQAAFRAVDYELPLALARRAGEAGVRRLFLVSSSGADARSSIFYSRVKGELDEAVSRLPFEAVHIFRPSLLLGERSESRPGERFLQRLSPFLFPLMTGPLRRYRPVEARSVALAMVEAWWGEARGVTVRESETL